MLKLSKFRAKIVNMFPWIRTLARKQAMKGIDSRRFWNGEPIPSPSANTPLFHSLNKKPVTLTYNKESRDCIMLNPREEATIRLPKTASHRTLKLSFACDGQPDFSEKISVSLGKKPIAELAYIVPKQWHHISANVGDEDAVTVLNNCASTIAVSHPIIQEKYETGSKEKNPKNIIVLILDSLTRDSLGSYDPALEKYTPHITRFFKKCLKFTNCFTQSEWTFPSIYSMLLSRYSIDHGMYDLKIASKGIAENSHHTLPYFMKKLEYTTTAYSTAKVFQPGFNAHVGFDRFFYDPFPQPRQTHKQICWQAITQLKTGHEGKNFLFLHFLDTHEPWSNTGEMEQSLLSNFRITDAMKEYDFYKRGYGDTKAEPYFKEDGIDVFTRRRNARLFDIDTSLGMLFDYLVESGEVENTVIALCSDHGYLYPGGGKPLLCDTRVHVPLLIHYPGKPEKTYDQLVQLNLDLGPTLVKIAGGDFESLDGKLLPPCGEEKRSLVFTESIFGNLYKAALRDDKYVYHFCCTFDNKKNKVRMNEAKKQLLFELKHEDKCKDVSASHPEVLKKMRSALLHHLDRFQT